jgi:hypothetical protein
MGYGYAPQMAPAINRIIKRPMTDMERGLLTKSYRSSQRVLKMIAFIPLALFLMSYLLPMDDEIGSFFLTFLTIILCVVVIGMSVSVLQFRKRMSEVLRDGTAIEVNGPAYRNRTARRNVQSFTVGPISLIMGIKDSSLIQEGAQVSLLCIPMLKIALSVNNNELVQGARIKCPPNLEATAEPVQPAARYPMAQPSQAAYSQHYPQPSQEQTPPYQEPPNYLPPPPPGWSPPPP